jgi:SpoVK/Ycf46/Vps4 family AAA+-type ATPase
LSFLSSQCKADPSDGKKGITQVLFELNHPARLVGSSADELKGIWKTYSDKTLDERLSDSNANATFALELLRQMTECNRKSKISRNNLLIFIEAADMLMPDEDISRMSLADRKRVSIVQDWFGDPDFMAAGDSVVLIAESRSSIHSRITKLPQVLSVDVPLPDNESRLQFINWFRKQRAEVELLFVGKTSESIADQTSGLSIHAIRQLLLSGDLSPKNISSKVEEYMISQLGEGVVEFQRPSHTLEQVIGFRRVKQFMKNELIPGFLDGSIGGAAVGGPIGGGKTFLCEAVASELGIPVILLKQIRSKWYGDTDAIFERLRRLLETFSKIVIFVDEADTQFGDVSGDDGGGTEKRLTGKIQAMMSDPRLKGRVIWFLMTARIHKLSPDIRRPGRMDLIIPILDPDGEDKNDFIKWAFHGIEVETGGTYDERVLQITQGYSSATFAALRSRIKSKACTTIEDALGVAKDILQPDIEETRRYQTLQALVNCTRKSLLFDDGVSHDTVKEERLKWKQELTELERKGIN